MFEADGIVGGLAKTVECNGYRFDLGGHRFFTKLAPIQRLWETMLGEEFLVRPRLSRIYYDGKYLAYPLQARTSSPGSASSSRRCAPPRTSWNRARRSPRPEDVRGLGHDSLRQAVVRHVLQVVHREGVGDSRAPRSRPRGPRSGSRTSRSRRRSSRCWASAAARTTLIEEFHYPRLGPGQMWEALRGPRRAGGHPGSAEQPRAPRSATGTTRAALRRDRRVTTERSASTTVAGVLSSIPLRDLVLALDPAPPPAVTAAAGRLRYRELCLVALMVDAGRAVP